MWRCSSLGRDGRVPPIQIFDTAVLIAHMDSKDPRHEKANEYVSDVGLRKDLFVQSATLLEVMPVLSSVQAANAPNRDAAALRERRVTKCPIRYDRALIRDHLRVDRPLRGRVQRRLNGLTYSGRSSPSLVDVGGC
jgi:predicted nucleic acid-binding protein